ncbi:MAG: hypothetical protein COW85_01765 [Ignavibacteria bacterium CG22_combo_CG10-13_8_21_14_all_37_15]|nr:hypothetical protein [Ignavibacteria bacterium]OIO23172.1 MAG: hypothetical protein AUJ54_02110 [Ignavibacteria bacterium CG1_02_37_35]PIP79250.1 MAG: hypothetical protein COW85_01765 [Ignavibacteria bacterium CG22_combo_CG10-13_8_21_14_all_37_15]PIS45405.1 MAG: hypothetical protein COT22_05465 [Ignavibacteria bacterium CG08_land_8_20_14_0_20_37_9]PIX95012.1 MAG: hypothetical protein COZ25_02430 [Ignavibacteria bacterium CG_4_10_14_3_um_filter_37_18]
MGYTTILDIIGAMVIGGILLLSLFTINDNTVQSYFYYNADFILQRDLVDIILIVEGDLRRIGYCADPDNLIPPNKTILSADSNSITFVTDLHKTGKLDTVEYRIGIPSDLPGTTNPRDVPLYRIINNNSLDKSVTGVVTEFRLVYSDALGDTINAPVATPGEIQTMELSVKVENAAAYNQNYSNAYWRQVRLASKNLKSR